MGVWSARVLVAGVGLTACSEQPCGTDVPIVAPPGNGAIVADLVAALEQFVGWTDLDVCLDHIELREDMGSDLLGQATARRVLVRVDPGTDTHEEILWHELCHVLDFEHGLSDRDDLFGEGAAAPDGRPMHPARATARGRQVERFALWCETGPTSPLVAAREETCGRSTRSWMNDHVWAAAPTAAVTITTVPEQRGADVLSHDFVGSLGESGAYLIEQTDSTVSPPLYTWSVLADGRPVTSFVSTLFPQHVVATGPDRLLLVIADRLHVMSAAGTVPADRHPVDVVGGFGSGSWWLWSPVATGEVSVTELDPEGRVRAHHALDVGYLPPRFVRWDGAPAFVGLSQGGAVEVRQLPTGRVLATAPSWPDEVHEDLLAGATSWLPQDDELLPVAGLERWWMSPDHIYTASECSEGAALPGRREIRHLAVEVGPDGTRSLVSTATTTYALP